jgi:phosphatidate phosphatase APP1
MLPVIAQFFTLFVFGSALVAAPVSDIERDYTLVFFPAFAHRSANGKEWELRIEGCVYEEDKRRAALAALREALQLEGFHLTKPEAALFNSRTRLFMVDHKPGKRVVIRVGDQLVISSPTKPNGRFSVDVKFSNKQMETLQAGPLEYQAVLPKTDKRIFAGRFAVALAEEVIVISDIDDTIKVTGVHDYRATVRNTLLDPYSAVPGMADAYRDFAQKLRAQFYYVSASPWQLFLPLFDFMRSNGFPAGEFCLKDFRLKDRTRFSLFESPTKFKPQVIEPLLKQFPDSRFILVGDSGEQDPEIYGALARTHPRQIAHIFIRELGSAGRETERYQSAFHDLPPTLWTIFDDPAELKAKGL